VLQTLKIGGVPEPFTLAWREPISGVEWVEFSGGSGQMCAALKKGELDAAFVLTEAAVYHGLAVYSVQTQSPLIWGVYTAQVDSFRAGRLAVSRLGSGSHLMAQLFLHEKGYDLNSVQVLEKGSFKAMCEAILTQQADFFLWEKNYTLSQAPELVQYTEYKAQWPAFVLVTRQGFQQFEALEVALNTSYSILKNWQESGALPALLCRQYGLSEKLAKTWLSENRWYLEKVGLENAVFEKIKDRLSQFNHSFSKNLG
jgi:hypothetical protein